MKWTSVLAYAAVFSAGTLFSGSIALAGSIYVKARLVHTTFQVSGKTVSSSAGLVYGGKTFVALPSVETTLKRLSATPSWKGSTLNVTSPQPKPTDTPGMSGGSTTNSTVWVDIGYSIVTIGNALGQAGEVMNNPNSTNAQDQAALQSVAQTAADNIAALKNDVPTDSQLQKVESDYVAALTQFQTAAQELLTAEQTNNVSLANQGATDMQNAATAFANVANEYQAYNPWP